MLQPDVLPALHSALDALDVPVDGWLLFDFRGLNPLMATVVGPEVVGSRRAYVYVPRRGVPTALVHMIDAELWAAWPGEWRKAVWVQREELSRQLATLVGRRTVAMEYSPNGDVPYGDFVPAGTLELVRAAGATPVSSADLVSRWCSAWTAAELESHRRAAAILADIARSAFALVGERARAAAPITEHALTVWVCEAIDRAGLVTDSTPSVSYGANAARAHYEAPADGSAAIASGALLLLDLWATEPGGIYADQTWMASIGQPSARAEAAWRVVREARDAALALLHERLASGEAVTGAEADRAARAVIAAAGHAEHTVGRTGHSIDRVGLHGLGPMLDDTESFDGRRIIPGVGFSVEPGIYIPGELGVRSEVNAYAQLDGLEVTPVEYQRELIVV